MDATASKRKGARRARRPHPKNHWPAQEAKARFSELIRRAREEGPQVVTLHGKEVVTVSAIAEPQRGLSGRRLLEVMQTCPVKDIDFEAPPFYGTFPDIKL